MGSGARFSRRGRATLFALPVLVAAGVLLGGSTAWTRTNTGLELVPGRARSIPRLGGPRLGTRLARIAVETRVRSAAVVTRDARAAGLDVESGAVRVIVVPRTGRVAAARDAVAAAGGRIEAEARGLVQARVPPRALERLAAEGSIAEVRPPAARVAQAVGEGVSRTGADAWQTAGFGGAGVKVAIIDLGFYGYAALLGSALPASVTTDDQCGGRLSAPPAAGGTEHGTALAEIVHQMAPGAQLYLMCVDTEVDLALAEQDAIAAGVRVVNHSVAWFNTGRGDGSGGPGTPDAIAADARAHGILWVNAAGNLATQHWSGTFHSDAADPDSNDFVPGDPVNDVVIEAGEQACVYLKWDDWPVTSEDFELALHDKDSGDLVAFSTDDQAGGPSEPTEALCYTNTGATRAFGIVIYRYSAVGSPRFDLFYEGTSDLLYSTAAGSIAEPAASPDVLAVGPACWQTGAFEPFGSRGPTIDGRTKPDVSAPDSVSTETYGDATPGIPGCGNSGFAGASASSAHVAGAAALLLQQKPGLSIAALEGSLLARALARRTDATSEPVSGSGALALGHPVGAGTIVYESGGATFTVDADGAATRQVLSDPAVYPSWSSDGSKILIHTNTGIKSIQSDGSGLINLYGSDSRLWEPDWSPDGSKVAFFNADLGGIWIVNVGTQVVTQLTTGTEDGNPVWSPDGTLIAYIAKTGSAFNIWVMHADGTVKTQLTNSIVVSPAGPYFRSLSWSPDGMKLAFTVGGNPASIWVMNANGTSPHEVVSGATLGAVAQPGWSPDSTQLIFNDISHAGLGIVKLDGTGRRLVLTDVPYSIDTPSWTSRKLLLSMTDPTLSGTTVSGEPLQADTGIWGDTADATFQFVWLRCTSAGTGCSPIGGATSRSYVSTAADLGSKLEVTVTATSGAESSSASVLTDTVVGPTRPVLSALPTIAGTPTVGSALSIASSGAWSGSPTFAFGWRRCAADGSFCSDIGAAAAASYTLTSADIGSTIRAAVTATNAGGVTVASSVHSAVITPAVTPKFSQAISFLAIAAKTFGDPDFSAAASASSGLPVAFSATGSCTIGGATVHLTGAGSCMVTASQSGNAGFSPAPDVTQTFAIAKANQTITFDALPGRTYPGNDFTVSAGASSGLTVSFTASGTCTAGGSTIHLTGVGTCAVTAAQAGDSNYNAAPDVVRTFAIAKQPSAPPRCTVPKVVGKRLTAAKRLIAQRHCRTGRIRYVRSRKAKKGVVLAQSRKAGRVLPAGSKIGLTVGRGLMRRGSG